ncbi:MAG: hypothetical protein V3W31_05430 [Thermodesulfobacteriota bacterium]
MPASSVKRKSKRSRLIVALLSVAAFLHLLAPAPAYANSGHLLFAVLPMVFIVLLVIVVMGVVLRDWYRHKRKDDNGPEGP